jgi:hypothetical protein
MTATACVVTGHQPGAYGRRCPCRGLPSGQRAAQLLCARLDSLLSRPAARSEPGARRASPARPRLVPVRSRSSLVLSFPERQRSSHADVTASPLRVAAESLRARRCLARPRASGRRCAASTAEPNSKQ